MKKYDDVDYNVCKVPIGFGVSEAVDVDSG